MEDSDRERDRAKYLFLSLLQARVGGSLVSRLGNLAPEAVLETPFSELADWTRTSEKATRAFDELQRGFDPHAVEARLVKRGIRAVTLADDAYPRLLRDVPDPPPALYVDGAVPASVCVALVGSRKASATGTETARALGRALCERRVCVVSGLALGVDAAAHEGAVEAAGTRVGVLGCGIDVTYPPKYKRFRVAHARPSLRGQRREGGSDDVLAMAGSVVDALHPRHRSNQEAQMPVARLRARGRTRKRSYGNVARLVAIVGSDPT